MILVIDNYDSFTYNLVQYLGELAGGEKITVFRNDRVSVDDLIKLDPAKVVLSPGPGNPDGAGICLELVQRLERKVPILGVCLGHQVIGQVYGGKIVPTGKIMHGKVSTISHNGSGLFKGVRDNFIATRYHSLVVCQKTVPKVLQVTAVAEDSEIMGLKHEYYPVWGIQFHPESILTEDGKKLISNFLNYKF